MRLAAGPSRPPSATAAGHGPPRRLLDALGQAVIADGRAGRGDVLERPAEELTAGPAPRRWGRHDQRARPSHRSASRRHGRSSGRWPWATWTGAFPVQRRTASRFVAARTDTGLYDEHGDLEGVVGISVNLVRRCGRTSCRRRGSRRARRGRRGALREPRGHRRLGWDDVPSRAATSATSSTTTTWGCCASRIARPPRVSELPTTVEMRFCRPDGDYVWAEGRWTNLLADPSIRGLVAIFRDVHERAPDAGPDDGPRAHGPPHGLAEPSVLVERLQHAVARRRQQGAVLLWTWTSSRRSTTAWGTPRATRSCRRWPNGCGGR